MPMTKEAGERAWLSRWDSWKERASAKHGGMYLYPDSAKIKGCGRDKIRIVCPEHGEFLQNPEKHQMGQGCPLCSGHGTDKLQGLKNRFPNWDWGGVEVGRTKDRLTLACPIHGEFETSQNTLMTKLGADSPCPKCSRKIGGAKARVKVEEWARRVTEKWKGEVTLDVSTVKTASDKSLFVCRKHGEFRSVLNDVVSGHGCPKCGKNRFMSWMDVNVRVSPEEFLVRANEVHKNRYTYDLSTFTEMRANLDIVCKQHGKFSQSAANHVNLQTGCPSCFNPTSKGEQEVIDYIESLGVEVDKRTRPLDGWEIDIFIPSLNVGVEYCGLYWHGEKRKEDTYHREKYLRAKALGITLITVFEDEWQEQGDKVKYRLLHLLGSSDKIPARKTNLRHVTWAEASAFLNEHHLQGSGKPAPTCYGLFFNEELQAVTTWGNDRFSDDGHLELYRYCTKSGIVVVGGLSKMVSEIRKQDRSLVTYADLRWGDGTSYGKVGFTRVEDTKPGYFWVKGSKRFNRQRFQKHKLKDILEVFDPNKTEIENCRDNGYWRIFDCGNAKWVME